MGPSMHEMASYSSRVSKSSCPIAGCLEVAIAENDPDRSGFGPREEDVGESRDSLTDGH